MTPLSAPQRNPGQLSPSLWIPKHRTLTCRSKKSASKNSMLAAIAVLLGALASSCEWPRDWWGNCVHLLPTPRSVSPAIPPFQGVIWKCYLGSRTGTLKYILGQSVLTGGSNLAKMSIAPPPTDGRCRKKAGNTWATRQWSSLQGGPPADPGQGPQRPLVAVQDPKTGLPFTGCH